MATVLKPVRIRADEIEVGDRVSKTKRGGYEVVIGIVAGERSNYISLAMSDPAGAKIGFTRIRPRHETKLWVLR
jgi:hypothetical protein